MAVAQFTDRTMANHESMAKMAATGSGAEAVANAGPWSLPSLDWPECSQ
jgi:hypothetical protein